MGWVSLYNCEGPVTKSTILERKVFPGLYLGCALYAEGISKRYRTGWRRWGVGDDGRIGNLIEKTQCERGDISQRGRIYFSNRRWTNQNFWRRSGTDNIHLGTAATTRKNQIDFFFLENQKRLFHHLTTHSPDAGEAMNGFRSMSGNFIYRHHVEPRVNLYSPREESFPFPLKYIDVSRTTHTNLDVKQEKRIDDCWNMDGSRDLSDPWTGFTQYFIDPEDMEFKETIKNARKKLETSVAPAMPCKIMKNCVSGASNKIQTKLSCILEVGESTRMWKGN